MESKTNTPDPISGISKEDRALIAASEKFVQDFGIKKIEAQEDYDSAASVLTDIKGRINAIEKKRVSIVKPINDSIKIINEFFKTPVEKLQALEGSIKGLMGGYIRIKEDEARKDQAAADEAARIERLKAEEAARKAREKAEAALAAGNDERAAKELNKAELKEDQAAAVVSSVVIPKVDKGGLSLVDTWTAKVAAPRAFLAWVIERQAFEYITINESLLNKEAKNTKGTRTWPGVEIIKGSISKMRI